MQTVTPPVFCAAWRRHQQSCQPGLWAPGSCPGNQETPQKYHGQAKFWSSFEANLAKSTGRKEECWEILKYFHFLGIYKSTKGSLMHLKQL